jgi:hypothetical protein
MLYQAVGTSSADKLNWIGSLIAVLLLKACDHRLSAVTSELVNLTNVGRLKEHLRRSEEFLGYREVRGAPWTCSGGGDG